MKAMSEERMIVKKLTNHIRMCGELACLLEVSATPKPGNVHRFRDFSDIRYEDFLSSSVSFGSHLEELALKGFQIRSKQLPWSELCLGQIIKDAIKSSNFFHQRTNTNLGIILLLSPLCVAAGLTIDETTFLCDAKELQFSVSQVMQYTTIEDAIAVSEGISNANPGGLGRVDKYDLKAEDLKEQLLTNKITLFQLMETCLERDNICKELVEGYPITFGTGMKKLLDSLLLGKDINLAIIDAYLSILANFPDSLIKRKFGLEVANKVSLRANSILLLGGALTIDGRRELEEFDIELQEDERINPGTSADLVAATIFVYLLQGGKI